ncbi:MAG: sigma-70 family RNA polymerase sigma factor [Planctomycetes bacterium]|nr:sigma-70 family RNA polymerase sigma factor [Planctomycetota bacterium]
MSGRRADSGLPAGASPERRSAGATSRSLLSRIRARDDLAWGRLVNLYAPLVCYWCRAARLSEHDVADVAQEVFQAIATHIETFQASGAHGSFRGWLRVITRNKLNDYYRRREREPQAFGGSEAQARLAALPLAEPSSGDRTEEIAQSLLLREALEAIRGEFAERTWRAFWRVVVDDRPAKEVAGELGMRPGTVRVSKSRVLQRLRAELGDVQD